MNNDTFNLKTNGGTYEVVVTQVTDIELKTRRKCAIDGVEMAFAAIYFSFNISPTGETRNLEKDTVNVYADVKHAYTLTVRVQSILDQINGNAQTQGDDPVDFIKKLLKQQKIKTDTIYVF